VKISILIPTYNEETYILQILKKVNEQKTKFNLEIVICDDGSTDQTILLLNENKNLFDKFLKKFKGVNVYGFGTGLIIKKKL